MILNATAGRQHAQGRYLSGSKGVLGMLVEGHHEVPKLAVGKGAVGVHPSSLQDLRVHLAQPSFQVIQQHLDGRDLHACAANKQAMCDTPFPCSLCSALLLSHQAAH